MSNQPKGRILRLEVLEDRCLPAPFDHLVGVGHASTGSYGKEYVKMYLRRLEAPLRLAVVRLRAVVSPRAASAPPAARAARPPRPEPRAEPRKCRYRVCEAPVKLEQSVSGPAAAVRSAPGKTPRATEAPAKPAAAPKRPRPIPVDSQQATAFRKAVALVRLHQARKQAEELGQVAKLLALGRGPDAPAVPLVEGHGREPSPG